MRKFINSLLYGSSKTKSYLWTMLILGLIAAGCISAALYLQSFVLGAIALLSGGLDVAIYQSVSFREILGDDQKNIKNGRSKKNGSKSGNGEESKGIHKKNAEELVKELGIKEFTQEKEEKKENEQKKHPLIQYNDVAVKKIMVKYKVKKEHKKIMIDSSQVFRISQCPAFVWKEKNEAKFLLLEEEPRIINISMDRIKKAGYKKMVDARPESDYDNFKTSCFVTKLFMEFLPSYKKGSYRGKQITYKNLYTVPPDIYVTAASARNLLDVLEIDFAVSDEITNSGSYNEYYKSAYRTNILWKDGVINTSEYKERIRVLLTNISLEKISKQVYDDLLNQLVAHKLITEEYAKYYQKLKK